MSIASEFSDEECNHHTPLFFICRNLLSPISKVKYLGIFLDKHLLWMKQVSWVNSKLNQAIGILSKLRYNMNLCILKIVCHSLLGSQVQYGAQLWGQENCVNQNNIQNLQNQALRRITF